MAMMFPRNLSNTYLLLLGLILPNQVNGSELKQEIDSTNAIPHEYIVSNLHESIERFSENVERAVSIQYRYGEAKALANLGLAFYLSGKQDSSAVCYVKSITIFEEIEAVDDLAEIYGVFGYQLKRRDLEKAKHYMRLAIAIAEKNQLKMKLAGNYNNYGVLKEMESDLDSAMYFYQKALRLKYELADSVAIPYSLNNIAGIYAMQGDFDKAFEYVRKSDVYRDLEEGDYGRAQNLVLRAEIFARQDDLDSAIEKYHECLGLAKELADYGLTRYCYEQLSKLYAEKQDYARAFENQKIYSSYKDSVVNVQTNAKIAELEIAYQAEKKDRLLAENNLKIRTRTALLLTASGVIVFLIVIAVGIYQSQKTKSELKQAEMEKRLTDEKLRISRELHDNIGSQLTFMISSIDNLTHVQKAGVTSGRLKRLSTFGREALKELRNTIWVMNHQDADLDQLVLRLNELQRQVGNNDNGIRIDVLNNVNQTVRLSSAKMLNLYRIVQEAIQNTIKHAKATKINVKFDETAAGFLLTVEDNGNGYVPNAAAAGNGLSNMKHRCIEAGGEFQIDTSAEGTAIRCSFILK